jgi:hypothetical protein
MLQVRVSAVLCSSVLFSVKSVSASTAVTATRMWLSFLFLLALAAQGILAYFYIQTFVKGKERILLDKW